MPSSDNTAMQNRYLKPFQTVFFLLLICTSIPGALALFRRFILAEDFNTTTQIVPWGLWVAGYIYFIGLSAGAFLLSSLIYVFQMERYEKAGRFALLQAFVCLIGAMVLIFSDLGHPFRSIGMLATLHLNPRSVMAWMFIGYMLYLSIVTIELLLATHMDRQAPSTREKITKALKVLGILGIPSAIFVHGGVGSIFATVKAHPVWATGLMPILFLISALVSGAALLTLIVYLFFRPRTLEEQQEKNRLIVDLGRLTVGLLFADFLSLVSEFLVVLYGGVPHHAGVYHLMMTGPFWYLFWFIQVLGGVLIPFVLLGLPRFRSRPSLVALASFLILAGIFIVRINIVIPTLLIPPFETLSAAYPVERFKDFYFPSAWEWFMILAAFSLCGWLFVIGKKVLPMQEMQQRV